jgi:hypothetical protein
MFRSLAAALCQTKTLPINSTQDSSSTSLHFSPKATQAFQKYVAARNMWTNQATSTELTIPTGQAAFGTIGHGLVIKLRLPTMAFKMFRPKFFASSQTGFQEIACATLYAILANGAATTKRSLQNAGR